MWYVRSAATQGTECHMPLISCPSPLSSRSLDFPCVKCCFLLVSSAGETLVLPPCFCHHIFCVQSDKAGKPASSLRGAFPGVSRWVAAIVTVLCCRSTPFDLYTLQFHHVPRRKKPDSSFEWLLVWLLVPWACECLTQTLFFSSHADEGPLLPSSPVWCMCHVILVGGRFQMSWSYWAFLFDGKSFLVFVGMALRKGCGKVKAVPDVLEYCWPSDEFCQFLCWWEAFCEQGFSANSLQEASTASAIIPGRFWLHLDSVLQGFLILMSGHLNQSVFALEGRGKKKVLVNNSSFKRAISVALRPPEILGCLLPLTEI